MNESEMVLHIPQNLISWDWGEELGEQSGEEDVDIQSGEGDVGTQSGEKEVDMPAGKKWGMIAKVPKGVSNVVITASADVEFKFT